ncbi:MAG: C45 family peptidase [Gemmobacter sp.]
MSNEQSRIGWLIAAGDAHAIGLAAGRRGRAAVAAHLLPSAIWQEITAPAHVGRVEQMAAATRARFPAIWQEIEGLAEGLGLPLMQVFAWNCRGDLNAMVPDGCTTVQLPGPEIVVAHNEDGLPFFDGHCFILDAAPVGEPGFRAFCYPGSIPGHTFAVTGAGIVQTVNNLRLRGVDTGLPRMVLGRALLACGTLDAALALLGDAPAAGGFHFTLAQRGDARLMSVENGGGSVALREIAAPALHANHALLRGDAQIVTRSSGDRQRRGDALIAGGARDPLAILCDTGGEGLPIFRRAPDDPDHENTLATAVFHIGNDGIRWTLHDPAGAVTTHAESHAPS